MNFKYTIYVIIVVQSIYSIMLAAEDVSFLKSSLTNKTFHSLGITVTYKGKAAKYTLDSGKTIPMLLLTADAGPNESEVFKNLALGYTYGSTSIPGNNLIIEKLTMPTMHPLPPKQVKISNPQKKDYQVTTDEKGDLVVQ